MFPKYLAFPSVVVVNCVQLQNALYSTLCIPSGIDTVVIFVRSVNAYVYIFVVFS